MKNFLKTFAAGLLAMFVCVNVCFSQALSPAATKLKTAYVQLKIYPGAKPKQLAYIKAFPENKQQFAELFQTGGLRSEYAEYVNFFMGMARSFPAEVTTKAVSIGKDMTYDAGAGKQLQRAIVQLGTQYPKEFAAKVKALSGKDIDNLAKFLADEQDHKRYTEYQGLIDMLNKTNESQLAGKLTEARLQREKKGN